MSEYLFQSLRKGSVHFFRFGGVSPGGGESGEGLWLNYDGMAGYDSWFANWPILYPAMITIVMAVTGANAYLASKILAMVLVERSW